VIGANSVVVDDLPPHVIAAGVPAKVIREIEFSA
jgi:acetyltransferase-like isoleucine patch superfamily enzyme